MAAHRLFPEKKQDDDDPRTPYEKFKDLGSKVVRVPKAEIDKREKKWQREHD